MKVNVNDIKLGKLNLEKDQEGFLREALTNGRQFFVLAPRSSGRRAIMGSGIEFKNVSRTVVGHRNGVLIHIDDWGKITWPKAGMKNGQCVLLTPIESVVAPKVAGGEARAMLFELRDALEAVNNGLLAFNGVEIEPGHYPGCGHESADDHYARALAERDVHVSALNEVVRYISLRIDALCDPAVE
jgi:hypothetical protein